jgi:N-acetylmuramoyl-L-alanine amidase
MKRVLIIGALCVLTVYYVIVYVLVATSEPTFSSPVYGHAWRVRTVVLDPGHGATDSGTTAFSGALEKEINLRYAQELRQRLEQSGAYAVILTRDDDVSVGRMARVEIAEGGDADAFISIHGNYGSAEKSGYMVIYSERSPAAEGSLKLARSIGQALQDHGFHQPKTGSLLLAPFWPIESWFEGSISGGGSYHYKNKRLGVLVNRKGITVLDDNPCPAVLIEVGYLSNREEEKKINEPEFRQRFCSAVELGLAEYFQVRAGGAP